MSSFLHWWEGDAAWGKSTHKRDLTEVLSREEFNKEDAYHVIGGWGELLSQWQKGEEAEASGGVGKGTYFSQCIPHLWSMEVLPVEPWRVWSSSLCLLSSPTPQGAKGSWALDQRGHLSLCHWLQQNWTKGQAWSWASHLHDRISLVPALSVAAWRTWGEAFNLSHEERLQELGLLNLEKRRLRGYYCILLMDINVSKAGVRRMVPDSLQWCPVTRWEQSVN